MKKLFLSLSLLLLPLLIPQNVSALEFKSGDYIELAQDASSSGSLIATGRNISIKGTVSGDLFCAGQNIDVSGNVDGDVICAGQSIRISGRVNGDIRTAGQTIELTTAQVFRNLTAFGQDILLRNKTGIRGEVGIGAQHLELSESIVGKDISGGVESANLNGGVGGNVYLETEHLSLGPTATIAGSLRYGSDNDLAMSETATVSGTITKTEPKMESKVAEKKEKVTESGFSLASIVGKFIFFGLIGLVLIKLAQGFTENFVTTAETQSLKSLGFGFLTLLIVPIVAILIAITLIGIPLTILIFLVLGAVIFISRILVAIAIGKLFFKQFKNEKQHSLEWSLLVGLIISLFLFQLPVIGSIAVFFSMLWGLGTFVLLLPWFNKEKTNHLTKKTVN